MSGLRSSGRVVIALAMMSLASAAQAAAKEFWLAPPDVSDLHGAPGGEPINLLLAGGPLPAQVTVDLPANGSFAPIVLNLPAYGAQRVPLTSFKAALESRPT